MKKTLIVLLTLIPFFSLAQNTEGQIIFKESVNIEIDLPPDMEHMKDMIPSSQSFDKVLLFNSKESIWKDFDGSNEKEATYEDTNEQGNVQVKMVMAGGGGQLYKDIENNRKVESNDFMGKKFLIQGEQKKLAWKLSGEQKKIAGFNCQQAILQDTSRTFVAWFSPEIPVSSGPDKYGQLPGMILEIDVNDGQINIAAVKVDFKKLEKGAIDIPTKGKKVTQEEYDKIVAEKTAEMEDLRGGNGGVQIKMRRN